MTREQWVRIKDAVAAALLCPPDQRLAHLSAACGSDPRLRQDAESLLDAVVLASDLYEHDALRIGGDAGDVDPWLPAAMAALPGVTETPDAAETAGEFRGTPRYAVRRRIGVGGMGVVYEVEDRRRGQVVALKTLRRWNPSEIYRLKREFRSLADIAHAHLVPLYELEVDDEHCFLTMALVDGVPFVDYVRAGDGPAAIAERARGCLLQLVAAVEALHRHGTRHGDLKPSNVLVTAEGTVVVLDFGLATSLTDGPAADATIVGTPAYVSPEQCGGRPATEASDWYAVGATLYHALAGHPPFEGRVADVLRNKVVDDPPALPPGAEGASPGLNAACMGLLRRDPGTRWQGADILRHLAEGSAGAAATAGPRRATFVGRESYLQLLEAAWLRVRRGAPAVVYLHGPSGIGKSALMQHFLDTRAGEPDVLVLHSRCHATESMPYKGLDGIIDGLSRWLRGVGPADAAALLGPDGWAVGQLFPVMQGLGATGDRSAEAIAADPAALRRLAFAALRDLIARVAARHPTIVAIDDFHWADAESSTTLSALFSAPGPAAVLLMVSFRSEEIETKPFLRTMVERLDHTTGLILPVAPLSEPEAIALVEGLSAGVTSELPADPRSIANEGAGHPLLIEELARSVAGGRRGLTLDEVLTRRLDRLPAEARAFLEALAVCGRPIAATRLFESCGLRGDERPLVAELQAAHFVRTSGAAGRVEMYHDRIRETLAAAIGDVRARDIHERLAALLVAHGDDEPESLFEHYRACGRFAAAASQAAAAAARAAGVLAFDRAATFYRDALALDPGADAATRWTAALATTLEHAGRPVEAAEAYLAAARQVDGHEHLEWRRKAAELLLVGGRIDEGLTISDEVLRAVGVRLAPSPAAAMASLGLRRLLVMWRGLDGRARSASGVAADELLRIDACWSISLGLAMVDPLRAADFNMRQLLWALEIGDQPRIARALALEAGFSAVVRVAATPARTAALFARAEELATEIGQPYVTALVATWAGISAFLTGRWAEATRRCEDAAARLQAHCTGVTWELNLAHSFLLYSLLYRGQLREAAARLPALLTSAREHGNVYLELELGTRMSLLWLADDDPLEADRRANDGIGRWAQRGFQRPHYHHLLTLIQTRLYRGRAREAWDLVDRHRRPLRQRQFRHVQHTRIETANVRARCALARAAGGDAAPAMRATARREAETIAKERVAWARPFAELIGATVAFQEGNGPAAATGLQAAADAFTAADMALYAAAARWRLASVVGGDAGRALHDDAAAWFAGQAVRDPVALLRVLAPGFPDAPVAVRHEHQV